MVTLLLVLTMDSAVQLAATCERYRATSEARVELSLRTDIAVIDATFMYRLRNHAQFVGKPLTKRRDLKYEVLVPLEVFDYYTALQPERGPALLVGTPSKPFRFFPTQCSEPAPPKGRTFVLLAGLLATSLSTYFTTRDTNDRPVAAFTIRPDGYGMTKWTLYTFDGTLSSDPDGDVLQYKWQFGDGAMAEGPIATHVYQTSGTYEVLLTVSDGKDASTSKGSVDVVNDVAGHWEGALGALRTRLILAQSSNTLSGTYSDDAGRHGSLTGSINTRSFSCPCPFAFTVTVLSGIESPRVAFSGTLNSSVTELSGVGTDGSQALAWTLRKAQ